MGEVIAKEVTTVPFSFRSFTSWITLLIWVVFLAAVTACGKAAEPDPATTVRDVARALTRRDVAQLTKLLVRDDGEPVTEQEVRELLLRVDRELPLQLERALSHRRDTVLVSRSYGLGSAGTVTVEQRGDSLLVSSIPNARACPHSVRDALGLLYASLLDQQRYYGTAPRAPQYLSQKAKEQWELELQAWLVGLARRDEIDIEQSGANARVTLPTGRVIELRREWGCMRIEALR